jgi:hypothetical protein
MQVFMQPSAWIAPLPCVPIRPHNKKAAQLICVLLVIFLLWGDNRIANQQHPNL